jgi:polyisoprenoid-binding protein YceI
MKTLRFTVALMIPALALLLSVQSNAQTNYKNGGKSQMTLKGTSTMHDWTMNARSFTTNAQVTITDNQLTSINGLTLVLPVQNLKSEKESMDENAYETLNAEKYRDITFKLTSAKVNASGGNKYQIVATGNLTISGVTKSITMNAASQLNADGSLGITGNVPLKLSDFNIERPSFMFGTMKVGNDLSLSYNLTLTK